MAHQLAWTEKAQEDIHSTAAYLLDQFGDTVADRFTDQLPASLRRLETLPDLGKRHPEMNALHQLVITPLTVLCYVVTRNEVVITNVPDSRNRKH